MKHLINFLDAMIEQPPKSIDTGNNQTLALSEGQRSGFKVACILVKSMIEQRSAFEKSKNKDA